ncbi:MAG: Vi polysaccharide biosynthesis UDP-N-acetylglucosamine C-6 dehydrogenase TviB [Candidatus Cloacimonadota bacterium]|nr:MAG: Vi polysaccharide biosynthesis UDP-N-acetylglucosamine C-6 dehydrogenase TviB [Candidatus Cloacimonadota bacterium]PIE78746.1 MAG: Vi polysaccharide biosynthesis UDP-N-acetylglucosamine C-6 dehydrogenase TviB [Candidatus Delongbacteria bacterium]
MSRVIGVIGLGYVGLPLAVEFGKYYETIGFDINPKRVKELVDGHDRTLEVSDENLKLAKKLKYTSKLNDLKKCNIFIVGVPTPVDKNKKPDLTPLLKATETVAKVLSKGDIVIYESTVYPGATEEDCVPILEKISGFKFNEGFYCGFSPERINPGDKVNTLTTIKKITSGSTPEIATIIDNLYNTIIKAGTHKASSIKVAEAAKVIENSQRDVNIAFVNELSIIFDKMGIDTVEVLEAAGTKWNFLPFRPGLVGGHCIGVDPYYLTHKAQEIGYFPEIILAGRRLNDNMGSYIASKVVKLMIGKSHKIKNSKVLIMGITFKENCPDIRNTKVVDVVKELKEFGCIVEITDPWADSKEVYEEYNIKLIKDVDYSSYNAIILAVSHNQFLDVDLKRLKSKDCVIYDVKSILPKNIVDERL